MSVVDKKMYETLKEWWENGSEKQHLYYINSRDRESTRATIRRFIFEIEDRDVLGDLYNEFFPANYFCKHMREFYLKIAKLYLDKPTDDDSISDIIKGYSSYSGWITLVVEDIDSVSGDEALVREMYESLFAFAAKKANVIITGNGDYKKTFAGCEYALKEMADGLAAGPEDGILMTGCYDSEESVNKEIVTYSNKIKQGEELTYYWRLITNQLKKGYFDYEGYKALVKETLEYLIPRVTKKRVYRKDLLLIEHLGSSFDSKGKTIDGCAPWEFDAAKRVADLLHDAIMNKYDFNDEFSSGVINLSAWIENPVYEDDGFRGTGCIGYNLKLSIDTAYEEIDHLAKKIHEWTYEGMVPDNTGNVYKVDDRYYVKVIQECICDGKIDDEFVLKCNIKERGTHTYSCGEDPEFIRQHYTSRKLWLTDGAREQIKEAIRDFNSSVDEARGKSFTVIHIDDYDSTLYYRHLEKDKFDFLLEYDTDKEKTGHSKEVKLMRKSTLKNMLIEFSINKARNSETVQILGKSDAQTIEKNPIYRAAVSSGDMKMQRFLKMHYRIADK